MLQSTTSGLTLGDIEEQIAELAPPAPVFIFFFFFFHRLANRPGVNRSAGQLPESLPREVIEHAAPCACPNCGGALRPLGEDVTEVLDYTPARLGVICARASETVLPPVARPLRRPRSRACPFSAAWQHRPCWRHVLVGEIRRSLPALIAKPKSTPAPASNWTAPPWPIGLAKARACCVH